ncbi:MAG: ABC transporter permease [Bacteroidales bacterium]|nr:ABC transporter permease [Bacteroidales bacterium]
MWKKIKTEFAGLIAVFTREFKLIFSDAGILLFLTFLPLGYPIIYSLIYNPEIVREVKMVIVDHDRSSESRHLARMMGASQYVDIIGYATDLPEGRRAMDSHECFGILEIPEGFGRKVGRGEQGESVIYCDMSLMLRYRGLLVAATDVAQEMGADIRATDINETVPLVNSLSTGDLLPIQNVAMGNIMSGFDSFIMPGVLILILHQCIILAIGMAGGAKRENPYLTGYNGVNAVPSVLMTMLGQMLCYFVIFIVPAIFLTHYVPLIFRFPVAGNPIEELIFICPLVIAAIGLGFCFQGVVWERESVFVLWVVTSVALLFLSGLTWPRYAITGIWRILSDILPATWGVEGFIRMNSNGADLAQVHDCYRNLWILAGAYMVLAYLVQRFVVRPSIYRRALILRTSATQD